MRLRILNIEVSLTTLSLLFTVLKKNLHEFSACKQKILDAVIMELKLPIKVAWTLYIYIYNIYIYIYIYIYLFINYKV